MEISLSNSIRILICALCFLVLPIVDACYSNGDPDSYCSRPPGFPKHIQIYQSDFSNAGNTLLGKNLWTAIPRRESDVIQIANWAAAHQYKARPIGYAHTWTPFLIENGTNCEGDRVILLEMKKYMTTMKIIHRKTYSVVQVMPGVKLETLAAYLEENGFGIQSYPDYGAMSILGILATASHGLALHEANTLGPIYGTTSGAVESLRAVVWNGVLRKYVPKIFDKTNPEANAFLVCLGRSILTSVTLRIIPNYNLRLLSIFDIPGSEVLGMPTNDKSKRTFVSFVAKNSALEIVWFPYPNTVWVKVVSLSPQKPASSKAISAPPIQNVPQSAAAQDLQAQFNSGKWSVYPELQKLSFEDFYSYMKSENLLDVWGPSKNINLRAPTPNGPIYNMGFVVITALPNVQNIVYQISTAVIFILKKYTASSIFPAYQGEIKISGLDCLAKDNKDVCPSLSPARPVAGHPELDTSLWFNFYVPDGAPVLPEFLADIEHFCMTKIHDGRTAVVRPEWAKNFAHTHRGPETDKVYLRSVLPELFKGEPTRGGWNWAISVLDKYDPKHTFSNRFMDNVLVRD